MTDIKFACPHCRQHIACDGDYAELAIECPSCGGTMAVPRLTAASSEHGRMVIVASTMLPAPRPTQTIPPLGFWNEQRWTQQFSDKTENNPVLAALWLAILFGTVVLTIVLITHRCSMGTILGCLVLGGVLTGFVMAKGGQNSLAASLVSGVLFAIALVVLVPVMALAILFAGCTACAQ